MAEGVRRHPLGYPGLTRFFRPIIEALKEKGGSGTTTEIIDRTIELLGLSEAEQNVELSSGGSKVRNQAQWARLYLVSGEFLDSSARDVWRLNEQGAQLSPNAFDFLGLFQKGFKEFSR